MSSNGNHPFLSQTGVGTFLAVVAHLLHELDTADQLGRPGPTNSRDRLERW